MQITPASSPFTLTTLSISFLATPIYEMSAITFVEDANAKSTVNITQTLLT
jgi:hypothetical protein